MQVQVHNLLKQVVRVAKPTSKPQLQSAITQTCHFLRIRTQPLASSLPHATSFAIVPSPLPFHSDMPLPSLSYTQPWGGQAEKAFQAANNCVTDINGLLNRKKASA